MSRLASSGMGRPSAFSTRNQISSISMESMPRSPPRYWCGSTVSGLRPVRLTALIAAHRAGRVAWGGGIRGFSLSAVGSGCGNGGGWDGLRVKRLEPGRHGAGYRAFEALVEEVTA